MSFENQNSNSKYKILKMSSFRGHVSLILHLTRSDLCMVDFWADEENILHEFHKELEAAGLIALPLRDSNCCCILDQSQRTENCQCSRLKPSNANPFPNLKPESLSPCFIRIFNLKALSTLDPTVQIKTS